MQDENKKLPERIKEFEFVKDFQQDIIADMEIITESICQKSHCPKH